MDDGRRPGSALDALAALMATLRTECPWDRTQTHGTLRRHLLEETYETLEALDRIDAAPDTPDDGRRFDDLREELGDLVFQVVFHAHLAAEAGQFDLSDVIEGVHTKLVERHPAIFADAATSTTARGDDLDTRSAEWERAKVAEKGRASVMDGIPSTLPALLYASKVLDKAQAVAPQLTFADAASVSSPTDDTALGRHLLAVVRAARDADLDPESALRSAAHALERAVRSVEGTPSGRT